VRFLSLNIPVLTSLTVNMRRYAALTKPLETEHDVAAKTVEILKTFEDIDVPV